MTIEFLCCKGRNINLSLALPTIKVDLGGDDHLCVDIGHIMGHNSEQYDQFLIEYTEDITLLMNGKRLVRVGKGVTLTFADSTSLKPSFEKVTICVP